MILAAALTTACSRGPQVTPRFALLPFDNLTGDASLDWIARTAPRIAAAEIAGTARPAATIADAYLLKANRFVHGYFTGTPAALRLNVEVEDASSHKMILTEEITGPLLADLATLSKRLDPKAAPFSSDNEAAIAAWGLGEFEKAVTLDPSFGAAWLSWIETQTRSGDTAAAIVTAQRALEHPVKSELDAMRIELTRATLAGDPVAEHDALRKLTARVADPQLLTSLGALEVHTREFALAQGDYKKILAEQPENAEILNLLGYAYGFDGKVADAEAAFAAYRKLPGQEPNSFDSLGEVYFMNAKFAEAEKAFLHAHELNPALAGGGDLRKAAYAHWLAGDLPGADKIYSAYLDFRAKMKDPSVEWQHAAWEFSTGRKDQAIARMQKSGLPQAQVQIRVWQGDVKLPSDANELKKAYEASQPASDGLYRTLYAEALAVGGNKDEAKKIAARWPLPDNTGEPVLQSLVFPKYVPLRRILGL